TFGARGTGGDVPVSPGSASGFVNGVLTKNLTFTAYGTAVVLTVSDAGGHTGSSNPFDVVFGPAARFVWNAIPSPQYIDAPFPITIRAIDTVGNSVPSYNGTASLFSPVSERVEILTWTAYADTTVTGEYVLTKQAISTYFTN